MSQSFSGHKFSYGFHEKSDYQIENFQNSESGMKFSIHGQVYENAMTGMFNAQNFVGAIASIHVAKNIKPESLSAALKSFRGLKRRQEIRFESKEHRVIDDFAHHPTAVRQVIESIRSRFPDEALAVIFEPRSHTTRRNIFQSEFESCFEKADYVYLSEVFKAEAFKENEILLIPEIVKKLNSKGVKAFGPLKTEAILNETLKVAREKRVNFLILYNGSFDGLHEKLISSLKNL